MKVGVCLKWVSLRPDVDPLTGVVHTDDRFSGISLADQAALEWALRMGEAWDAPVTVASVGPPVTEHALRDALACGATAAARVDATRSLPSRTVAELLATALVGSDVIVCGEWSLDRGSASVPPFLAAITGSAQACGLVGMTLGDAGSITAERRLDGGRRERLRITAPAVVSVEGSSARLRRAALAGVLSAQTTPISIEPGPRGGGPTSETRIVRTVPFRPRTRILDAPEGDVRGRANALLGLGSTRTPPQRLVLDADAAADRILAALGDWGELPIE